MDSLETTACFRDDLFDFPSDISDDDDDHHHHNHRRNAAVVLSSHHHRHQRSSAFSLLSCPSRLRNSAFPEFVEEEELEWISNKDAFPMVESFVDIMPNHPSISTTSNNNNNNSSSHLSPVSVLKNSSTSCSINSFNFSSRGSENDNNNNSNNNNNNRSRNSSVGDAGAIAAMIGLTGIFKVPGRARSKQLRRRKRVMSGERFYCWEKVKPQQQHPCKVVAKQQPSTSSGIGRKCLHCGSEKTPQWRAGPLGPKTLCNACGVRYKSGRLVPEYRPASSPTFSSELHSNSHRKIVEMRKQKMSVFGDPEEQPVHFS